jgi:hypothetical protein
MPRAVASSGWEDGQRKFDRKLLLKSQHQPRACVILAERRGPMRAYVTAAGMALGLVAVWVVLVPFVA